MIRCYVARLRRSGEFYAVSTQVRKSGIERNEYSILLVMLALTI